MVGLQGRSELFGKALELGGFLQAQIGVAIIGWGKIIDPIINGC